MANWKEQIISRGKLAKFKKKTVLLYEISGVIWSLSSYLFVISLFSPLSFASYQKLICSRFLFQTVPLVPGVEPDPQILQMISALFNLQGNFSVSLTQNCFSSFFCNEIRLLIIRNINLRKVYCDKIHQKSVSHPDSHIVTIFLFNGH